MPDRLASFLVFLERGGGSVLERLETEEVFGMFACAGNKTYRSLLD